LSGIDLILVPQGIETSAVKTAWRRLPPHRQPRLVSIPATPTGVKTFLKTWQPPPHPSPNQPLRVLLVGLAGSLSTKYSIGDVVLGGDCICGFADNRQLSFHRQITSWLQHRLSPPPDVVGVFTSHRVISQAAAKQQLHQRYGCDVVDMEAGMVLQLLATRNMQLAMLRVISDDCRGDLPDLTAAFNENGSLQPFPLAAGLLRNPVAAWRLMRGSQRGLRVLAEVMADLWDGK
jgi:hypothetical protein